MTSQPPAPNRHEIASVILGRWVGAIALPDGTVIRGRGRREPFPAGPLPDFGLYLGRPLEATRRGLLRLREPWAPDWPADWPADWIDWPDFAAPRVDKLAADLINHAYLLARAGQRVEIACHGGTGRTGTVIACMAILAGHPAADALTWTRAHYRPRAAETPGPATLDHLVRHPPTLPVITMPGRTRGCWRSPAANSSSGYSTAPPDPGVQPR